MRNKQHGTTLPELLLATALLGILSAWAAPRVGALVRVLGLRRDLLIMSRDLDYLAAAARQGGEKLRLEIQEHGYAAKKESAPAPLLSRTLHSKLTLSAATGGAISFYPSGVTSPATVTLQNSGRECLLILSLRGRIRSVC